MMVLGMRTLAVALAAFSSVIGVLFALIALYEFLRVSASQDNLAAIGAGLGLIAFGAVLYRLVDWADSKTTAYFHRELSERRLRNPTAILDIDVGRDRLLVTKDAVAFQGRTIPVSEVSRIRFRNTLLTVNFVESFTRDVTLAGAFGKMTIDCGPKVGNEYRSRLTFETVMQAVWSSVCLPMLARWRSKLAAGESIKVRRITITAGGLVLRGGGFFGLREVFTPWADLKFEVSNGRLRLWSSTSAGLGQLNLTDYNAMLVHALVTTMAA